MASHTTIMANKNQALGVGKEIGGNALRRGFSSNFAGSPGKVAQRLTEAATTPLIARGAERLARKQRLKKIQENRGRGLRDEAASPPKKLSGPGFWMVVGAAILKDTLDVFLNISILFSVLVIFTGLIIIFIVSFYLFYNGVKLTTKKLAVWAVSAIIEIIPFLSILPTYSFTLLIIRAMENNEHLKKAAAQKKGIARALLKATPLGRTAAGVMGGK